MQNDDLNDVSKLLNANSVSIPTIQDSTYRNNASNVYEKFNAVKASCRKPNYFVLNTDSRRRNLVSVSMDDTKERKYSVPADGYYFIQAKGGPNKTIEMRISMDASNKNAPTKNFLIHEGQRSMSVFTLYLLERLGVDFQNGKQ